MPSKAFIFYGSLKDPNNQKAILDKSPIDLMPGFIRGDLYVVTDLTDPFGVCVYPIVDLSENGSLITAVLAVFKVEDDEEKKFLRRLEAYEGSLYQREEAPFFGIDGNLRRGFIFVAKKEATKDPRVQKVAPRAIYNWRA